VAKPLIIVESPTKAKTIKKFLPARFVVKASVGHVRDLPKSTLGVDVLNGFTPRYLTIKGKGDIIKDLKAAAKAASEVYLATDPDREGEAIAWHLAELLKLENPKRIELHEITKDAAMAALKDAHAIDMPRVNAQQARRILDRLVGYKISPLLWAKVRGGLSAGRVQSVAVRLIVDREREIRAFVPREYWTITAQLAQLAREADAPEPMVFPADLLQIDGVKAEITNGEQADEIMAALQGAAFRVESVKTRETRRNAAAPFTTSTLQQEASRKLKFRVRKTMQIAQALYEGVDLGRSEGTQGLITYMRTDSTRIADSARDAAREYITSRFGAEYHSGGRQFKLKEGAQDAHEAIRPTSVLHTPESLSKILKRDELRLYQLIWERFVASQMAPAVFDQTTVDIAAAQRFTFRATGSVLKFAGFTAVYEEGTDDPAAQPDPSTSSGQPAPAKGAKPRAILPKLSESEDLDPKSIDPKQHFTEPPPRFTEASLVRALEENGIGRPSTYSAIVETIQARGYAEQLERRFHPTEIGEQVNELLEKHFPDIVDLKFTASMEGRLDELAETGGDWEATAKVLGAFYVDFEKELAEAERVLPKFEQRDEPTDEVCVNCGKPMVIKTGRFGKFMSCTGYPECKTTKPILKDTGVKCPKDGGMVAERKSRKGRTFYGCANYPACDFVSWDPVASQPCAVCGDYVVEKRKRGGGVSYVCHTDRTHATGLGAHPDSDEADGEAELEPV